MGDFEAKKAPSRKTQGLINWRNGRLPKTFPIQSKLIQFIIYYQLVI